MNSRPGRSCLVSSAGSSRGFSASGIAEAESSVLEASIAGTGVRVDLHVVCYLR